MTDSQPLSRHGGSSSPGRYRPALVAASMLGPIAALLAVWLPEVHHYYVATPRIGPDVVAELRRVPDDSTLGRIDGIRFALSGPDDPRILADEMLAGRYHTPQGEVLPALLEPTDAYLRAGSGAAQLQTSSLIVVETLLDAYRETGNERYFDAALTSVLGWARFERNAWLPPGFLWNDHAVAARVLVLTRFWREYRKRPDFDAERGAEILAFVARSTELLARPSHYTVRTNHGIMQDLALLHAGVAFPRLPQTAEHEAVALDRLAMHLPFYVSPGGITLEHSTGYQELAIHLLRSALVYAQLLDAPIAGELAGRYAAAECLQRHVTRPDGSLPYYGDTLAGVRQGALIAANAGVACGDQPERRLDEDFGIASVHDAVGTGARLFMTWANFPGRSHKHDDELSTWLWLDGQDWWTASGYWPYDDVDRSSALSWRGANAPHAAGEGRGNGSDSRLLTRLRDGPVQFLDVERRAPDGRAYRRQVVWGAALGFLVVDSATGGDADARFESVWTLVPGITVQPVAGAPRSFELRDPRTGRALEASFAGEGQEVARLFGSRYPFGGLVARDDGIRPSAALVVSAPFDGASVARWRSAGGPGTATALAVPAWRGPEQWTLSVAGPGGDWLLARSGSELSITAPHEARRSWRLEPGAPARPALDRAAALYAEAAARYPPFRDYVEYRVRATVAVAGLFVAQYLLLWLCLRLGISRVVCVTLLLLAWAATTGWLYYEYLV